MNSHASRAQRDATHIIYLAPPMFTLHSRRNMLRTFVLLATPTAILSRPTHAAAENALRQLEQRVGGRLGVAAINTGNGRTIAHRADERFPMASTFKFMLCAAVMAGAGPLKREKDFSTANTLARRIRIEKKHLIAYSPIVEKHVGEAMTVAALCDATIRYSDNAAGNLLLKLIGGPPGFTAYARSLGDTMTRLDRTEPALNTVLPGDPRDTTTPAAMRDSLVKMVLADGQPATTREQLKAWLIANTTGDKRIRAGTPMGWIVGDKTGTGGGDGKSGGGRGATNDIAIIWPPNRAPIALAIYTIDAKVTQAERDAMVAEAARIALAELK
jgi:beta-lactamase class A